GQGEVAKAGKAGQRMSRSTKCRNHARNFRIAASDQGRAGRGPKSGPVHGAAGKRIDILECSGDFDANSVVRCVGAEAWAGESGGKCRCRDGLMASQRDRSWQARGKVCSKAWAREHIATGGGSHVGKDFALERKGPGLKALGGKDNRLARKNTDING